MRGDGGIDRWLQLVEAQAAAAAGRRSEPDTMAVLLETSKGDIVLDLYVDDCPSACKNFLKLCKCVFLAGVCR